MKYSDDDLKLIFVLKIGYNSKGEGLYEFIFSVDETNIDVEKWNWHLSPACDNVIPPTEDYIDKVINLKTKSFNLFCLHEAVDREYMHGYHTIHALAYETELIGFDEEVPENQEYLEIDENAPLLVFHYGMTLTQIKDMFNTRRIILKNNEFIETSSIKFE